MKGDLGNLMKQAQESLQKMQEAQKEAVNIEVNGESGGGMVKVIMNGKRVVKSLKLDDSLLSEDRDMLEDMIIAAFNDAVGKVEAEAQAKMSSITSGIPLPPGFKLDL